MIRVSGTPEFPGLEVIRCTTCARVLRIYGIERDATTCHEFDTEFGYAGQCERCFEAAGSPMPPDDDSADDNGQREIECSTCHQTVATCEPVVTLPFHCNFCLGEED